MIHNIIFCLITAVMGFYDFKFKRIPNGIIVVALLFSFLGGVNILSVMLGVLLIVLPMIIFYKPNSIGGGDIKMIMVMCFYLGYVKTLSSFVIGILLCLIYAKFEVKRSMILAPFFSIGTIITIFLTGGFTA